METMQIFFHQEEIDKIVQLRRETERRARSLGEGPVRGIHTRVRLPEPTRWGQRQRARHGSRRGLGAHVARATAGGRRTRSWDGVGRDAEGMYLRRSSVGR